LGYQIHRGDRKVVKSTEKEKIIIKCRPELKKRFKVFKDIHGFDTHEQALEYLLDYYQRMSRMKINVSVFGPREEGSGKKSFV